MRPRDLVATAGAGLVVAVGMTGCLGVTDKHSTLVKEVPVNLNFKSTPTPGASPSASVLAGPGTAPGTPLAPGTSPAVVAPASASPAVRAPGP